MRSVDDEIEWYTENGKIWTTLVATMTTSRDEILHRVGRAAGRAGGRAAGSF